MSSFYRFYNNQNPVRFTMWIFAEMFFFSAVLLFFLTPCAFAEVAGAKSSGGSGDPGSEKAVAKWRCKPTPVGDSSDTKDSTDSSDSTEGKSIKADVGLRNARGFAGLNQEAKRDIEDSSDSWEFEFYYGVSAGYETIFRFLGGLEVMLSVMPVLEIRKFRSMDSSLKAFDRVLRLGLRMDFGILGCYLCQERDSTSGTTIRLGPEASFRMYWPGKNQKRPVSLLHGPFAGIHVVVLKGEEIEFSGEVKEKSYFVRGSFRVGYEFGLMLLQRYQILFYGVGETDHDGIFAVGYGINIAYVY